MRLFNVRIYRGAFVFTLLALVVVMFSLEERPAPLVSSLAPDAFDDRGANSTLQEIARIAPDRRPDRPGRDPVAALAETRLRDLGFETSRDTFTAEADGKDVEMVNVTGVLSGPSERQVAVLAHRDAIVRPGASSASSTAALLELARATAAARHGKTLVFVSLDGGAADGAGAKRFVEHYPQADKVDSALVIDDPAAAYARRPYLVPWSSGSERSSLRLLRTATAALGRELGAESHEDAVSVAAPGQFIRQAWPLTLREQGSLLRGGLDAITLTASGDVPRAGADGLDRISRLRMNRFGKAALATVLALDSAPEGGEPDTYLTVGRQVVPGWSLALLAIALLLPPLAAAVDALARARRRGRPVAHWVRWALAVSAPFVFVLAAARIFELLGWLPGSASEAISPLTRPSGSEVAAPLMVLALLFAFAWVVLRPRLAGDRSTQAPPAAAEAVIALTLVLGAELVLLWVANPFAALLLVPVLHLCMLTAFPGGRSRRLLIAGTIAAAALLPALVLLYYGDRLDLGLHLERYALLLLAGDTSFATLLAALIAGSLVSAVLVALARPEGEQQPEITVRGPATYAGPGSLGGTRSALRR